MYIGIVTWWYDPTLHIKYGLTKVFLSVKDLGNLEYCLGIEFTLGNGEVKLCQKGYIQKLLERFNIVEANPVQTPLKPGMALVKEKSETQSKQHPYRELVGSLMYLAVVTRPDINFAVSYLSQFNNCYGTNDYCLIYQSSNGSLIDYADADWGGCVID